ncbi:MAG TPA: phosphopantothenoylcysteine decarboxylase [Erysipelothrix sp.]
MAKIIITAGGTQEKIDDVRSIHNQATGKLGSLIAERLFQEGHEITYIYGPNAHKPQHPEKLIAIESVNDLDHVVRALLSQEDYDVFIHSMAVSDFFVSGHYTYEEIKSSNQEAELNKEKANKISSDKPIYLQLSPAPKVIAQVKKIQPDIKLIGFKLLAGATDEELIAAAQKQISKSHSDFVIANHIEEVHTDKHRALFISHNGVLKSVSTKQEIADYLSVIIKKEATSNE